IIGCEGAMQTTAHADRIGDETMTMDQFLDSHINKDSEFNGFPVPPFYFPYAQWSGPDIAFVVRFIGNTPDEEDIKCVVFAQLKLRGDIDSSDAEDA
ncbi:hypothetical protein BGZ79_006480, partial [Entomortierella chlamydospora]